MSKAAAAAAGSTQCGFANGAGGTGAWSHASVFLVLYNFNQTEGLHFICNVSCKFNGIK